MSYYNVELQNSDMRQRARSCFSDLRISRELAVKLSEYVLNTDRNIVLHSDTPGAGCSMIARRCAGLKMSVFRAPHHTISQVGMVGTEHKPGEVDIARGGILYLDNVIEMRPHVFQCAVDRARVTGTQIIVSFVATDDETKQRMMDYMMNLLGVSPEGDEPYLYVPTVPYAELLKSPPAPSNAELRAWWGF